MTDSLITSVVTVLTAIIGVAILAILVSKNSNTSGVIGAGANAFSGVLGTALSPVSGQGSVGRFNLNNAGFGISLGG